ncbi:MAG: LPS export ABC transporter permease LptG [Candidatus Delongbacteria bacterium]|nr:LPS export ABC transporter permease LptG [Candidatus Delongbacteria bacterium]MBN2834498.1 LPS export ABC transporter permease LptG [Candidatus Delongbacteria bacterium]
MLKLYDRYILNRYINTVIVTLIAVVFVYILIDLFENLNKFLDAKTPFIGYVIVYSLKVPIIISQVFPAIIFMSLLFTFGSLNKYNEVLSLITSGISYYRISIPIIFIGIFFACFHFAFSELFLPITSRIYVQAEQEYLKKGRKISASKDNVAYQEGNDIVYIKNFSSSSNTAFGVSVQRVEHGRLIYRIDSDRMVYRENDWVLTGNKRRDFTDDSLYYSEPEKIIQKFNFTPKEIKEVELKPIELGYFELKEFIKKKEEIGIDMTKWHVELHSKVAYSSVTLVMILIAVPLSAGRVRASASVNFGISILTAFTFYLIIIMFKNWGMAGDLDPLVAAWSPNLMFVLFSIYLYLKVRS